jgi:8-amino-7-oxononanoate synthase
VKAGYNILESLEGEQVSNVIFRSLSILMIGVLFQRRERLQKATSYFLQCFFKHPIWNQIKGSGAVGIANPGRLVSSDFQSPIVPVTTKAGKAYPLRAWLLREGFSSWGIAYPVVPKGEDRVRVVVHADNSHPQIERFVDVIMQWALEQEKSKKFDFKAQL